MKCAAKDGFQLSHMFVDFHCNSSHQGKITHPRDQQGTTEYIWEATILMTEFRDFCLQKNFKIIQTKDDITQESGGQTRHWATCTFSSPSRSP